jgi:hypothetical protein
MSAEYVVPWWRGDPDYYPRSDPRYAEHRRRIEANNRIDQRIAASSGDRSYSIVITKAEG